MKLFLVLLVLTVLAVCIQAQACTSGFQAAADCTKYYQCSNGQWILMSCAPGLNWNSKGMYCDWPATAGCTTGATSPPSSTPTPTSTSVPPTQSTSAPVTQTTSTPPITPIPCTSAPPPTQSTSTSSPVPVSPGTGRASITQSQFNSAAATKGGSPDVSYYNGFINSLPKAGISDITEAAKFLAHTCWETVGFQYTKEVYCQTNMAACANAYPSNSGGLPGKVYYGRGMLQITWDYNYKAASAALYGDNRLIQNPDQVADVPQIGWDTAAWFWITNVHAYAATFGGTLKQINGALECDGGPNGQDMTLRFNHYKQILSILGLPIPPDSDGYCHA